MRDPCRIEGPACISFSGGRTSGYMLWRILQAHGGALPEDVVVMFANTGKEMPETLDFVQECSEQWGVPVTWIEYRAPQTFAVVTHETASREGEPFAALIEFRKLLPNPVARFCTQDLKIRPMKRYLQSIGWDHWDMVVGLRADEPRRVAKLRNSGREVYERIAPLAEANVTAQDVGAFWQRQPFDLRLPTTGDGQTMHGNCDLCFLKGAQQTLALIRERPQRAVWWMAQEVKAAAAGKASGRALYFRDDRPSYAEMHRMATQHGELFAFDDEALTDCACTD